MKARLIWMGLGALLSACANKPLSPEEAVQQFGKGGLWLRPAGLFEDYDYRRLEETCAAGHGIPIGYDAEGYEKGKQLRWPERRRPVVFACTYGQEVRWGVSFRWFNERMVVPFLSDKPGPAISVTAAFLDAKKAAELVEEVAGKTEREQAERNERVMSDARARAAAARAEEAKEALIRLDAPDFRVRVKPGDLCNIDRPLGLIPCLVIEVRKPLVLVQVGTSSQWIRIEELMSR